MKKLKNVEIPSTVAVIGKYAFMNCSNLENADLSKAGITELESGVFAQCTSLKTVSLPDGLLSVNGEFGVNGGAFSHCSALNAVSLPDSVETIGVTAFRGCTRLATINDTDATEWLTDNGFKGAL